MDRPTASRHATERAIEQWLDQGPDQAPERLLTAVTAAIEAGTVRRTTLVNRTIESLTLAGAAAAVVAAAIVAIGAIMSLPNGVGAPDASQGDCPRLVEVVNSVLPPAADPDGNDELVLARPYVAVMGARLENGNQIATVQFRFDQAWDETLDMQLTGPVSREGSDSSGPSGERLGVTLGTPGTYQITYVGRDSGCRSVTELTAELDSTLRTYDAERGLSEPPPADMR